MVKHWEDTISHLATFNSCRATYVVVVGVDDRLSVGQSLVSSASVCHVVSAGECMSELERFDHVSNNVTLQEQAAPREGWFRREHCGS